MRKSILTIHLCRIPALLFIAALLLLSNTWLYELQAQITNRQYKIQVGAYQSLEFVDEAPLGKIGNVYVENGSDGIHRIVLGYYTDRAVADVVLAKAIAAGYRDAFVAIADASAPIPKPEPAQMMVTTPMPTPPVVQPQQPTTIFTPPVIPPISQQTGIPLSIPTATPAVRPASRSVVPTLSGDQIFAIYLGRYTPPVKIPVLGPAGQLGQIYKRQDNDQQTTVFFGLFADYKDAQKAFSLLKIQAGYASVRLTKVDKISLEEFSLNNRVTQQPTTYTKNTVVTTQQAVSPPLPLTNVVSSANVPLISTTPGTTTHPSIQHFEQFKGLFTRTNFNLFMVDVYDPTQENAWATTNNGTPVATSNQSLKGNAIPSNLYYLFDRLPNRDAQLRHYALYQYPLNNNIDAYVIRSGKGMYHQDNYTQLYLFDKTANRFIAKELLSHIVQTNAANTKIKSWIVDLDQNGSFDILTYILVEPANSVPQIGQLSAKVWQNGQFIVANIGDETEFKRKLGLR